MESIKSQINNLNLKYQEIRHAFEVLNSLLGENILHTLP